MIWALFLIGLLAFAGCTRGAEQISSISGPGFHCQTLKEPDGAVNTICRDTEGPKQ